MMEKVDKVSPNWSCYDCTEKIDGMQKEEKDEETSSRKRKAESIIKVIHVK